MTVETGETAGNGRERNFAECPRCGQKLLNAVSVTGLVTVVVKCRRCGTYVHVRIRP